MNQDANILPARGKPLTSTDEQEKVLTVHHWTDKYFSFTTTRSDGLRFQNGQFVTLGLEIDGKLVRRAYSVASSNWEEELESSVGLPKITPANDRIMICGGMAMLKDLQVLLDSRGFTASPGIGDPGNYVIERAFVTR
jgi:ferredoxin-NADP reductase